MRRYSQDEISGFLDQAIGKTTLDWHRGDISWRVTIAHTHGDVVAMAVWSSDEGYIAYHEELSGEFLRGLRLVPAEPLFSRLRRLWTRFVNRFR